MSSTIHFLNTGHSDCIILESNGRFAMIDAAEDTDYPADKPHLKFPGYEDVVCDYLLKNCRGEDGRVTLDFVMGTHSHSDHIGGFDTVINHPDVTVKRAFLKPYHQENIFFYEIKSWDNLEVYTQMKDALDKHNVPIVESFEGHSFNLGDFRITFYNGTYKKPLFKYGENVNSVVTLVEAFGKRALLAGDMNYKNGGERSIGKKIGKVDLLKVGHHGYSFSTSLYWVKCLMPDYAVFFNELKNTDPVVRTLLEKTAGAKLYASSDCNGVKAVFSENGIDIITDIM